MNLIILLLVLMVGGAIVWVVVKLNEICKIVLEIKWPFLESSEEDIDYWLDKAHKPKRTPKLKKGKSNGN